MQNNDVEIAILRTELNQVTAEMKDMKEAVRELTRTLHEVQGGWKTLGIVASVGGAIAGVVGGWVMRKLGG